MRGKRFLYSFQIPLRQDHVRVEHNQPFAVGTFGPIVATLPRATILLHEILHVQSVMILFDDCLAVSLRAVFNNKHLEILGLLVAEALQEFVHFVRTIIDRNNDRVFHSVS